VNENWHQVIENLAVPHRAPDAYRALERGGLAALPAVRAGLRHESADVRHHCCRFLDQYLQPDSLCDLLCMLDDVDERVRVSTLHTLACDRCKQGSCRPCISWPSTATMASSLLTIVGFTRTGICSKRL
jgi:hypothetical protein